MFALKKLFIPFYSCELVSLMSHNIVLGNYVLWTSIIYIYDWTKYVGVYDYIICYEYISLDCSLTNAIKIDIKVMLTSIK